MCGACGVGGAASCMAGRGEESMVAQSGNCPSCEEKQQLRGHLTRVQALRLFERRNESTPKTNRRTPLCRRGSKDIKIKDFTRSARIAVGGTVPQLSYPPLQPRGSEHARLTRILIFSSVIYVLIVRDRVHAFHDVGAHSDCRARGRCKSPKNRRGQP